MYSVIFNKDKGCWILRGVAGRFDIEFEQATVSTPHFPSPTAPVKLRTIHGAVIPPEVYDAIHPCELRDIGISAPRAGAAKWHLLPDGKIAKASNHRPREEAQ